MFPNRGGVSPQYSEALDIANKIQNDITEELTFVGHSLGGGLSAACAFAIGGQAVTFNPAGVSPLTQLPNSEAKIDTYIALNDPLNFLQQGMPCLPGPNGTIHYVMPKNPINGHSISNFYGLSMGSRIVNASHRIINDLKCFWKSL